MEVETNNNTCDLEQFLDDIYEECSSQQLAIFAGVGLRRVQQWENEGVIEAVRHEGNKRIYDKYRSIRNVIVYYRERSEQVSKRRF